MPQISNEEYCVRMGEEAKTGAFWRDCITEVFATFLLVSASLFLQQNTANGTDPQASLIQFALGMAFVWVAIGYGLGDYGGAHMNSAITFACLIRKEITFLKALIYWVMQGAGAIGAAFFIYAVTPSAGRLDKYGLVTIQDPEDNWWRVLVMEAFAAFIVCITYLGTFNVERKGYIILSSIPVGLAVGAATLVSFGLSGGVFNPARAIGPAVVGQVFEDDSLYWSYIWVYVAGPMGGALLAGIFYWIFDSVGSSADNSPYYMQSGTWNYNNQGKRSHVVPASQSSKEVLNSNDGLAYTINGASKHTSNNGLVSAYSPGNFDQQL